MCHFISYIFGGRVEGGAVIASVSYFGSEYLASTVFISSLLTCSVIRCIDALSVPVRLPLLPLQQKQIDFTLGSVQTSTKNDDSSTYTKQPEANNLVAVGCVLLRYLWRLCQEYNSRTTTHQRPPNGDHLPNDVQCSEYVHNSRILSTRQSNFS